MQHDTLDTRHGPCWAWSRRPPFLLAHLLPDAAPILEVAPGLKREVTAWAGDDAEPAGACSRSGGIGLALSSASPALTDMAAPILEELMCSFL